MSNGSINHTFTKDKNINHTFTKNLVSPQDSTISIHHEENHLHIPWRTISTHHEDNQMHHANVKDASAIRGSKTNLQHLQTLNKYINAKNSHSTMVLSNHGIIKSISYMKIQTKLGNNLALSPHHYHKLPLNHVSKLSMTSWWKYHPLTMRIN